MGNTIICSVCGMEGKSIICSSGNKTRSIVYHAQKRTNNICNIAETTDEMRMVREEQTGNLVDENDLRAAVLVL